MSDDVAWADEQLAVPLLRLGEVFARHPDVPWSEAEAFAWIRFAYAEGYVAAPPPDEASIIAARERLARLMLRLPVA